MLRLRLAGKAIFDVRQYGVCQVGSTCLIKRVRAQITRVTSMINDQGVIYVGGYTHSEYEPTGEKTWDGFSRSDPPSLSNQRDLLELCLTNSRSLRQLLVTPLCAQADPQTTTLAVRAYRTG